MKAFNKQTLMTAGLLAVLATQISFSPATDHGSADLAQVRPTEVVPSSTVRIAPAPSTSIPIAPRAKNPNAVGPNGPKPGAARTTVVANVDAAKELEVPARICNADYKIKFTEADINGKPGVRAFARLGTKDVLSVSSSRSIESVIASTADQDAFVKKLTEEVEKKNHCNDIVADESTDKDAKKEAADKAAEEKEKAEKIARGVRNCTLDAKGKALKGDAKDDCNLDRIEKAAEMADDSTHRRSSGAGSLFQSAVDDLTKSITAKLLSDKKDSESDGKDLMENTIESLSTAGDCEQTKRRTVTGIEKKWSCGGTDGITGEKFETALNRVQNLKTGDDFEQHSEFLVAQYSGLDKQIEELKSQINSSRNIMVSATLGRQLDMLNHQKEMMKIGLTREGDSQYNAYATLQKTGGVQVEEFSDFTATYHDLLAQISGNVNANRPGSPTISIQSQAPNGAADFRRTLTSRSDNRSNGVKAPQRPF